MRVADVIADGLRRAQVARVFVADGADPSLLDAVRASGLSIVPVRAAASACVMAAITGALGDAPGAALVPAADPDVARTLADALRDRAPAVVVASCPLPATVEVKATVEVGADSAAHWIAHAAQAAMKEPPGPVWLAVEPAVATRATLPVATATRPAPVVVDAHHLDAVAERLAGCERPLIVAGRECRAPATAGWLRAFAESLPAPVLVTPAARGALPDPHPLAFGLLRADAAVLARADLIVALGVDGVELEAAGVTLAAPVLRLGRGVGDDGAAAVVAEGEVPVLLEELAPRLRGRVRADWDVAELDRLRRAIPAPAVEPGLAAVITWVRDATPAGTAAVFARALEAATPLWQAVGPGELIVADPVVPAAIAVALARPESVTLVLARGDDTPLAELAAAVAARARVIVIVADGRAVGDAAGARIVRPLSLPALSAALGGALDRSTPTVIVVSTAG